MMDKALGRPTTPPPPVLNADSECKWIEEGTTSLDLPDFPDFPAQFELPPVPPIPRLLPDWGWVQSLSERPLELHAQQSRATVNEAGYFGLGLGLGIGAVAGVALLGHWQRRRGSGRMALQKRTSSGDTSARAVDTSCPSASGARFSA